MSKTNRLLAIITSGILVVNYIEIQIEPFILKESHSLLSLDTGLFRVIFILSLVTSYFFLARYFKSIFENKIEKLLYWAILLTVLSHAFKFIGGIGETLTLVISSSINLILFIIIAIFCIKIFRLNESKDKNIKLLKTFVLSLFGVLTLHIIGIPILIITHKMEYFTIILFFYTVPYSILTYFFWKLKEI